MMAAALTSLIFSFAQTGGPAPEFVMPVDCQIGRDCLIQQYVDHDPGEGAIDYRCGRQSYDGHKGTDFRLPNLVAVRVGTPVLAAAGGRVRAVRDGEPDLFRLERAAGELDGKECGNGIVIQHSNGWETQYCHMRNGSIRVRSGDEVTAGDLIGLVGLSGKVDFPHLHLTVRHLGEVIDPFAPEAEEGTCGKPSGSLWAPAAQSRLAYQDTAILNAGFADAPVTNRDIEEGAGEGFALMDDTPALVVFARMINAQEGDRLRLSIDGPGSLDVRNEAEAAPRVQAQRMAFAGRKRPAAGWPKGVYEAKIELVRGNHVIAQRHLSLQLD